jgi:hypothetical protein
MGKIWKRTRDRVGLAHADVLMTSFPKCGRTWLRLMIGSVLQQRFHVHSQRLLMLEPLAAVFHPSIPDVFVEHDGHPFRKRADELDPSKAKFSGKKVILVVRDPRDVMVSAYFHKTNRKKQPYAGAISDYIRDETGSLATFIGYYNGWAAQRDVPSDFLLVRYEDLHAEPQRQLRRVLTFIGVTGVSDALIEQAVHFGRFDNMRRMEASDTLGSSRLRPGRDGQEESYKTRKGAVGRYGEYLSEEDLRYIDERVADLDPMYGYGVRAARAP